MGSRLPKQNVLDKRENVKYLTPMSKKDFTRELNRLSKRHGWTKDHIINESGLSKPCVYDMFRVDGRRPSLASLVTLAVGLGLPADHFKVFFQKKRDKT